VVAFSHRRSSSPRRMYVGYGTSISSCIRRMT
jgi:hypothetical protein